MEGESGFSLANDVTLRAQSPPLAELWQSYTVWSGGVMNEDDGGDKCPYDWSKIMLSSGRVCHSDSHMIEHRVWVCACV